MSSMRKINSHNVAVDFLKTPKSLHPCGFEPFADAVVLMFSSSSKSKLLNSNDLHELIKNFNSSITAYMKPLKKLQSSLAKASRSKKKPRLLSRGFFKLKSIEIFGCSKILILESN